MHPQKYNDPGHVHFLTFSCYHKHQFLTEPNVREWLVESINWAREHDGFALWAYVFMPDHVHMLIHPLHDSYSISTIQRDMKEPVTHRLVQHWRDTAPAKLQLMAARQGQREVYRLWQSGGGYDRNLYDWEMIEKAMDYIEWNPVRRGLVADPTDWVWSSARARAGFSDALLSVDALDAAFA